MIQLFKDKKYWKEMGILLLIGIGINIACFCMPMIGHCANLQNTYPYYINETYNASGTYNGVSIVTNDVNALYNAYFKDYEDFIKTDIYQRANLSSNDKIIVTVSEVQPWTSAIDITFSIFVNPTCNTSITDNTIFSQTSIELSCVRYKYTYEYSGGSVGFYGSYGSTDSTFNILGSANFFGGREQWGNNVQILNYPLFMVGYDNGFLSSNNLPVIAYTGVSIGDFTDLPPLDEILNNINENFTPHTNNTPPTYDSNLSDGENISNAITGHSTNMNNAINNLGENVKNFFNKLYEKLTNVGNKISQNIYNGFSTLMQNIKDFFGPKLDSINDKLGQLVDHISQDEEESQQEIQTALQGTTFYKDFDDMKGLVSDSVAIWNSTSAPSEYKIPFHVERIAILNCDEVQYIDLSLFSPVFPYLRGVMWALVTYSLVYTVIDAIASYISGGDE